MPRNRALACSKSPAPIPAMKKFLRRTLLAFLTVIALAAAWDVITYDAKAWQADYTRLKHDMARGYANLDWIVDHRKLDIRKLDRDTTAAIDGAHSRVRAFLAIRRFVRAFHDPHFRLKPGERPISGDARLVTAASLATDAAGDGEVASVDTPAGEDCAAAGYEEGDHGFRFPFSKMPGYRGLAEDADFPTAIVGDTGILRIAQFGEDQYLAACTNVFKPGIGEGALKHAVRGHQQGQLRQAIKALRDAGARRLLVDVTGNGGGTEWVSEVIALMTDKNLSRNGARLLADACDRSGIWRGEPVCPALVADGDASEIQGNGIWSGPLLILADRGTGSASEDFVAWLQQNGVATVIGERTAGAGCGYVNGGTRTQFRASPFDVMMPNCARFLGNGINEIEGIAPDVPMAMKGEGDAATAERLAAILGGR